jgi:hypothetical protein
MAGPNQDMSGADRVMVKDDIATAVAELWRELLRVPEVGSNDGFLLLGGESLLATQAAARLKRRFGCDVGIRSILTLTVTEVAAEIARKIAAHGQERA